MPRYKSLPLNEKGRDLLFGDVHGAFSMLERALDQAKFDPSIDRAFCVGDLIDRGPESPRALEFLNYPWFHCVHSNHHQNFLELVRPDGTYDAHRAIMGGCGWIIKVDYDTLRHLRAKMAELPYALDFPVDLPGRRGTIGVIHAEVPGNMTWQRFTALLTVGNRDACLWAIESRERINRRDDSGVPGIDRVFCGHTPQHGGLTRLGNVYYIDTGAVFRDVRCKDDDVGLTFVAAATGTVVLDRPNAAGHAIDLRLGPIPAQPFGKYTV